MALSGLFFVGFLVSVVSILTTAHEFSMQVKYSFAAFLGLITFVPLVINIMVFLDSPYSRWLYIKDEFHKLCLSDYYPQWDGERRLKGISTFCNQSRIKKSVLLFHPVMEFSDFVYQGPLPNFPFDYPTTHEFYNDGRLFELKSSKCMMQDEAGGSPSIFVNTYDFQEPESKMVMLNITIHDLTVNVMRDGDDTTMHLMYPELLVEEISCNMRWDCFLDLLFILSTHKARPETGLCKFVKFDSGIRRYHSLSYQEISKRLSRERLFYTDIMENFTPFVVEGLEEDCKLFSDVLKFDLSKRFGSNVEVIIRHHLLFWGKMNKNAINYIIKKNSARCYRDIGRNWKSKRYLVDVSLFLECMGLPRFQSIDLKIKATRLASSLSKSIEKGTGGEFSYSRVKNMNCTEELKRCVGEISKLKNSSSRHDKIHEIKTLKNILKSKCEKTKPMLLNKMHANCIEKSLHTSDVKLNPGMIELKYESTYPKLCEDNILIRSESVKLDYKEALNKKVNSKHKELQVKIEEIGLDGFCKNYVRIKPSTYASELNLANCSAKSKVKHLEQLGRYNGFEPKFPLDPAKWHRVGKNLIKCSSIIHERKLPISLSNTFDVLEKMEKESKVEELRNSSVCIMNTWKRKEKSRHIDKGNESKNQKKKKEKYRKIVEKKAMKNPRSNSKKREQLVSSKLECNSIVKRLKKSEGELSAALKKRLRNARIDETLKRNCKKIYFKEFMDKNETSVIYQSLTFNNRNPIETKISRQFAADHGFPDY